MAKVCDTRVPSGRERGMAGPRRAGTARLPASKPRGPILRCRAGSQGVGQGTWQGAAAVALGFFQPLPMI